MGDAAVQQGVDHVIDEAILEVGIHMFMSEDV